MWTILLISLFKVTAIFCYETTIDYGWTTRSQFTTTAGLPCPSDYSDGKDGSCYSYILSRNTRVSAYSTCANMNNGYLFDINNAFQNTKIQQMANNANSNLWLGLTCTTNDKTSCVWDATGKAITTNSYSNFASNNPNPGSVGACVVIDYSSGYWYSADCNLDQSARFGCKYTPGANIIVPNCSPSNFHDSYAFRKTCYWVDSSVRNYAEAQSICAANCGQVASIHSPGVNQNINSLVTKMDYQLSFVYIGLQYSVDNKYTWDDGSKYNYSNFGYENTQIGTCVTMAQSSNTIQSSTWINVDCSEPMAVICQKDWINSCDFPTTPATTKAPSICPPSAQFFSGNGTIYSTGYPYGMDSKQCTYIVTVEEGQFAEIFFAEIQLKQASLYFYSDFITTTAISHLANTMTSTSVTSPTNMLKMVYYSSSNDGSFWVANYRNNATCSPPKTTYYFSFFVDTTSNSSTDASKFYYSQKEIIDGVAENVNLGAKKVKTRFFLSGVASNYKPYGQVYEEEDIDQLFSDETILGKIPDISLDLTKAIEVFLYNSSYSGVLMKEKPGFVVLFAQTVPKGSTYNFNLAIQNLKNANYFVLGIIQKAYGDPTSDFVNALGAENVFTYTGNDDDAVAFINKRACQLKPF